MYNCWVIPLRNTFPYQTAENTPAWLTLDYSADVIYLLDVAFVKPRLKYLEEGFWVADLSLTRSNYIKKWQFKVSPYRSSVCSLCVWNSLFHFVMLFCIFKFRWGQKMILTSNTMCVCVCVLGGRNRVIKYTAPYTWVTKTETYIDVHQFVCSLLIVYFIRRTHSAMF